MCLVSRTELIGARGVLSTAPRKLVASWAVDPSRPALLLVGYIPTGIRPPRASPSGRLACRSGHQLVGSWYLARRRRHALADLGVSVARRGRRNRVGGAVPPVALHDSLIRARGAELSRKCSSHIIEQTCDRPRRARFRPAVRTQPFARRDLDWLPRSLRWFRWAVTATIFGVLLIALGALVSMLDRVPLLLGILFIGFGQVATMSGATPSGHGAAEIHVDARLRSASRLPPE